jgi:hypothetical protein
MTLQDLFDLFSKRFDAIDARFDGVDTRFGGIEERIDTMDARVAVIENKVGKIEVTTRDIQEEVAAINFALESDAKRYFDHEVRIKKLERAAA